MAKGKKRKLSRVESAHALVKEPTRTLRRYPLPGTFMVSGLIGFVISIIYTASGRFERWFGDMGLSLGVAFMMAFLIMFVAALLSITPGSEETG